MKNKIMLNSCFFFDLTAFIELLFVPLSGINIWQKALRTQINSLRGDFAAKMKNKTIKNVGINLYKNFFIASFFVSLLPRDTVSVVFL